jgi:hypothetical protein
MAKYETLDISGICNVGLSEFPEKPALGLQEYRGIPFMIGGISQDSSNLFLKLDFNSGPTRIKVDKKACQVIFAHRLLDSKFMKDGSLGCVAAEYKFRMKDGSETSIAIRERFEIASVLPDAIPGVPGAPFSAVPDSDDYLMDRFEGRWDLNGRRQMESAQASVQDYYLWNWCNELSGKEIDYIELIPGELPVLIAAVTLSNVDENPFARVGRRPVKIEVNSNELKEIPSESLTIEVDTGVATYPHSLPEDSADKFIRDKFKGWGEAENSVSKSSYVDIAATNSADIKVMHKGNEIGSASWGKLLEDKISKSDKIDFKLIEDGKNWVHVKVVDDETNKIVPCRVHFRSPDGVPYQPHGHHNQVNSNLETWHIDIGGDVRLGRVTYAYIDGTSQGWLPRGEVLVDVARGFEYEPLRIKEYIKPGQRELNLRLKRWTNMNKKNWYSGDSHVHFLGTQGAHTESMAEDLNVVNLLQSQWGSLFTNTEDFTGHASVSQIGDNIVYVSQENRQHFMGHMILWGLKNAVMPWSTDGPGEGEIGGAMETTLSHWADEAHAQGGYVISPHFPNPNGEPATLIATGRLDGIEMLRQTEYNHQEYYRYLNCGYKLPLVGGTDKMDSNVPVGLYRTYVRLDDDQEFTYQNWCENVKKGRTFLSGGPIMGLNVEGAEIGDTFRVLGPGEVQVSAFAESVIPINTLEIICNGKVVASVKSKEGQRRLEINEKLKIDSHSWVAARAGGPSYFGDLNHMDVWNRGVFAHTSPIYIECGGKWQMFDRVTAEYMLNLINGSLSYINNLSTQDDHSRVTHHHHSGDHMEFLQKPFKEAYKLVSERIRKNI